jgi:hypothetical protein
VPTTAVKRQHTRRHYTVNAALAPKATATVETNTVSITCPWGSFWEGSSPLFFRHQAAESHNDSMAPVERTTLDEHTQRALEALDHFPDLEHIIRVVGHDLKLLYSPVAGVSKDDLKMFLDNAVADAQQGPLRG